MNLKDISLKQIFALEGSVGVGNVYPTSTNLQSRPPKPWPRGGQSGDPNQSPSMMASRLMQQTQTNDDIKYWMGDPDDPDDVGATFNPPSQFPSPYSDYMRVSKQWMSEKLGKSDKYLSNMEDLQELFGFGNKPAKMYQKLLVGRKDYQARARDALQKSLVHKKFKEKIITQGTMTPRRIRMIEEYEDAALEALTSLNNETEKNVQFLRGHYDEFSEDPNYASVLSFYQDMHNKVDQALFSVRQATRLGAVSESLVQGYIQNLLESIEEMDEISSIGGGTIRGHIGPLGSDNQSPYLEKGKKKKKHYEPSMKAFGGASEVD